MFFLFRAVHLTKYYRAEGYNSHKNTSTRILVNRGFADCGGKLVEVYLDVLVLENLVINYLILYTTAKFSKNRSSHLRLLLGALVGAAYVVVLVMLPGIKVYYTTLAKIILSLAIVAVAFRPEKVRTFLKTLTVFYVSTFLYAGACFAFLYLSKGGGFVRNGIVFISWKSPWTLLFLAILAGAIIIRVFWEQIQLRLIREKLLIQLKIVFDDRISCMAALVDTGNSLHDPLTNTPVIVAEFKAIREILPLDIQTIFEESRENDLSSVINTVSQSDWFTRFRLIPFTSLGKENGMLIGFKPDYVEIGEEEEGKGIQNVIVGIYNKALSRNEKYNALLNPDLV